MSTSPSTTASGGSPGRPTVSPRSTTVALRYKTAAAATVVALAVHLWGLYRDHGPPSPTWFPHADKVEHLVGFGLPCFLVLLTLQLRATAVGSLLRTRTVGLVTALFAAHAVVSEIVQGAFYTTRSGDPYDTVADLVGTTLGVLGFLLVRARSTTRRELGRHGGDDRA